MRVAAMVRHVDLNAYGLIEGRSLMSRSADAVLHHTGETTGGMVKLRHVRTAYSSETEENDPIRIWRIDRPLRVENSRSVTSAQRDISIEVWLSR